MLFGIGKRERFLSDAKISTSSQKIGIVDKCFSGDGGASLLDSPEIGCWSGVKIAH